MITIKDISIGKIFFVLILLVQSIGVALGQTGKISGKVTDSTGEPLPGVSVFVYGTSKGTATDGAGDFSLDASAESILTFSFIGFASQEIKVEGQTVINVTLIEDATSLAEVIITGVFDQRTAMESSIAISSVTSKQMERMAPTSSADLLKNIPGVYVNQARGEIWNTVYSRGISAGSIDNANGYYYVSMQEDGLSVTNINMGVDYFLRADIMTQKVEAVRGGTASILGANAPGGIFNYITKTGGSVFGAEVRAKYGLEGNGKNPYYRVDATFGGPISKTLTYSIGGFYRNSQGARDPGYSMNNGGQIRGNLLKTYGSGSLKIYGKYLNDKNAVAEFIPTQGWDNPKIPNGFSKYDSYYLPDVTLQIPINDTGTRTFKSTDKIHSIDKTIGLTWNQELGSNFSIKNDARFSKKSVVQNIPAVVTPFATDGFLFYAIPHLLGNFGNYSFTDRVNGNLIGNVVQGFDPTLLPGPPFTFTALPGNDFPGSNVQANSLFFLPLFYSENKRTEFADQFVLSKKLENMSFNIGAFISNTKADIIGAGQDFGIGVGTMQDKPHLTDIVLNGTKQVTDPNGFMDVGRDGTNISQTTQSQLALFFGHDWSINEALNFDWGVRYEHSTSKGFNAIAVPNALRDDPTYGGRDGDPATLYDNGGGTEGPHLNYDFGINTLSFSGGLNYKLNDNHALYIRYSQGNKSPDVNFYTNLTTPFLVENTKPEAQRVSQVEVGFKIKTEKLRLTATPFYSVLSNVPQSPTFTNESGAYYNPPPFYNKYNTTGVELETNYAFTRKWLIRLNGVVQRSIATVYKTWQENAPGQADDTIVDFSGNETDNNANLIFNINPIYNGDKFYASLNFSYMGARQANVSNAFILPAFNTLDLSIGYDVSKHFRLQGNINNLLDSYGILGWSGPGGFPAALNRQGFDKAFVKANPNAIFATQGNMPRAYFLTATYTF